MIVQMTMEPSRRNCIAYFDSLRAQYGQHYFVLFEAQIGGIWDHNPPTVYHGGDVLHLSHNKPMWVMFDKEGLCYLELKGIETLQIRSFAWMEDYLTNGFEKWWSNESIRMQWPKGLDGDSRLKSMGWTIIQNEDWRRIYDAETPAEIDQNFIDNGNLDGRKP